MMHRTSMMALGFILIFVGAQMNVIERYTMTPRMANFMSPETSSVPVVTNESYDSPYYQASYGTTPAVSQVTTRSRDIVPPRWLCWPVLFLGAVVLLHGATMRRD